MNKNRTLFYVFSIVFTLFVLDCSAQQVVYEDAQIKITSIETSCLDASKGKNQTNLLLSIENLTSQEIIVQHQLELDYQSYCIGCFQNEQTTVYENKILAQQQITGVCFDKTSGLSVVSKINLPGSKSQLQNLKVKNIVIQ